MWRRILTDLQVSPLFKLKTSKHSQTITTERNKVLSRNFYKSNIFYVRPPSLWYQSKIQKWVHWRRSLSLLFLFRFICFHHVFQALSLKLEEMMVGLCHNLTRLMEMCLTNGLLTTALKLATLSVIILYLYAVFNFINMYMNNELYFIILVKVSSTTKTQF